MPSTPRLAATIRYVPGQHQGIAYPLYQRVQREMALRGWTATYLESVSGVRRSTLDNLKRQVRPPQARTVNALADCLGIDREEALRLAGIWTEMPPPGTPGFVAEHWDDPRVRTVWGMDQIPAETRAGFIAAYLQDEQASSERQQRRA